MRISRTSLVLAASLCTGFAAAPASAQAPLAPSAAWQSLYGCAITRPSCFLVTFYGSLHVPGEYGLYQYAADYSMYGVSANAQEICVAVSPTDCWWTYTGNSVATGVGANGFTAFYKIGEFPGRYSQVAYDWNPQVGTLSISPCCDANFNGANVGHQFETVQLAVVPEPATFALVATGMLGATFMGRRRRRA